ncbi:hypothetical protein tloyanaT_36540 [Thalassotalea loyana]|uniref:Mechanosensitive ion channel family protein n=1 Tax=Thalassotalea loyana TaxID=280483 RepID=A0ABQ6HH18_9GAMM|nr:mechanosensitive ion channel family protein [Thalassotalea loyana]GLX87401.1 hypothetical protein tloyanaT_36540 [Thalassotalea loyana]
MRNIFLIFLGLWYPSIVMAQSVLPAPASTPTIVDESTPRKTVQSLLSAVSEASAKNIRAQLDTRESKTLTRQEISRVVDKLGYLLDNHGTLMPVGLISNLPSGADETGLDKQFEKVGNVKVGGQSVAITLQLIEDSSGEKTWLVSQDTIKGLYSISLNLGESTINQILPKPLIETNFRGAPIGQWLSVIVLLVFSGLACRLVTLSIRQLAKFASKRNADSRRSQVLNALSLPLGIIFAIFLFVALERSLGISIIIRQDMSAITVTAFWVAVFLFVWSLIENLSTRGEKLLRSKNQVAGLSIVIFFKATAKAVLLILSVILLLNNLGIDVTTGLAALGIGGIALALGAQKAIENLVGSIIIIIDQPIRVGDFCRIGDMLGTVENIGLRSTRIRTREDTLVSIPNGMLSSERIENYALRRKYLLKAILNLRYETSMDDLENILQILRQNIKNNKYVASDNQRVRFIAFGASSLDVEVLCYVYAGDYDVFLERKENILMSFSGVIEANNSGFAFPSQTLYLSKDK